MVHLNEVKLVDNGILFVFTGGGMESSFVIGDSHSASDVCKMWERTYTALSCTK